MTDVDGRSGADRDWLRVRNYLRDNRYDLSLAASRELYPDVLRVADMPLLTVEGWLPWRPLALDEIALELDPSAVGPGRPPGERYSDLMRRLAPPAVFENRPTYRVLGTALEPSDPRMRFGSGYYFDSVDTGEAVAHEYAARQLGERSDLPMRETIGSSVDPARRPMNVAVSALTIRYDAENDDARFLVHRRDPAKVGHAGGLFQVIPVGVFQPATDHPNSVGNDFSLWRCLQREYAEELLGEDEAPAEAGPIDYASWPAASALDRARDDGTLRTYCLGMGVDPLTLATDLLVAVVLDAGTFDDLFRNLVRSNAEGDLAATVDGGVGHPFTAAEVDRLTRREPMQAAGAAVLALAWQHRGTLLIA